MATVYVGSARSDENGKAHNGKTWISDLDNNSWEPGVYGWTEII